MNVRYDARTLNGRLNILVATLKLILRLKKITPEIAMLYEPVDKIMIGVNTYNINGFGAIVDIPLTKIPTLLFKRSYTDIYGWDVKRQQ